MTGKIIAVANMKGGVGKTATVIGLAEALAAESGARVLVMDFDPQASASIVLAGDQYLAKLIRDGRTIEAFLEDYLLKEKKISFDECVRDHISNVSHGDTQLPISLLASSTALRTFELRMMYQLTQQKRNLQEIVDGVMALLQDQLRRSARKFDYILIDCPPGISTLTEASIRLANLIIVPTIPDALSTYGLHAFCNSVWPKKPAPVTLFKKTRKRKLPYVLITRQRPILAHQRMIERLLIERSQPDPAFEVFETIIPERAAITSALEMKAEYPSFSEKWTQPIVDILSSLVLETKEALNGA